MKDRTTMNPQEFAENLDRWGSDLATWPPPQRASGQLLLESSERARELLAEAIELDRWLARAADHQAPLGLARQIVSRIPDQDAWQRTVDWFSAALWRPALAAACMLLVGFAVGLAQPEFDDDVMFDNLSLLAFSTTYQEFEDAPQ